MSIIDLITQDELWIEYLDFKRNQASVSKFEINELEQYISNKQYVKIVNRISNGDYKFSIPTKSLINKVNSTKKRAEYTFNQDENMLLKLVTYLFSKKYDDMYSDNCFSFRRKYSIKDAFFRLINYKDINDLYGYKVDISNYFNSIDVKLMLEKLKNFIQDDIKLYKFIEDILCDDRAYFDGEIIHEPKGIMAGIPVSSFLANIYLMDIDKHFEKLEAVYIRYSDDIIFFSSKENMKLYEEELNDLIIRNKITFNSEKVQYINPGDEWSFLGFKYQNGIIDVSEVAKKKIKAKIKRSSRKLRRWMLRKNASPDRAIVAVIRKFNKKFFGVEDSNVLTWELWYFPVINTSEGLHEIDLYMQQCLRYIVTGKYGKKNFNTRYEDLKKLGYKSLVNKFYNS